MQKNRGVALVPSPARITAVVMSAEEIVWVFNGPNGRFPSGVFPDRAAAEAWIARGSLSGTLTAYPLGVGVYEWAVGKGYFKVKQDSHRSPEFVQDFSTASLQHCHYESGRNMEAEDNPEARYSATGD